MKTLFVGGTFDDNGGKPSKIARKIASGMSDQANHMLYCNGGNFQLLYDIFNKIKEESYDIIFWFANVSNDKPKLIKNIKAQSKSSILVSSKRNLNGEYSFEDLQYRAFENKANLVLEFHSIIPQGAGDVLIGGRILDPLGNVFMTPYADFELIGSALFRRASKLKSYTRIPSKQRKAYSPLPYICWRDTLVEFCDVVKKYADKLHEITHVHPSATNRFLGNASMRTVNGLYVTKRNIDKRKIDEYSFVRVRPVDTWGDLTYDGNHKPSIDAPIHTKIFEYYKNINYIIHLHAYLKKDYERITEEVIPCGALEEFKAIKAIYPDPDTKSMFLDLKGHGSLIMSHCVENLKYWDFVPRPVPEIHNDW